MERQDSNGRRLAANKPRETRNGWAVVAVADNGDVMESCGSCGEVRRLWGSICRVCFHRDFENAWTQRTIHASKAWAEQVEREKEKYNRETGYERKSLPPSERSDNA
jgi:hypothetical protein